MKRHHRQQAFTTIANHQPLGGSMTMPVEHPTKPVSWHQRVFLISILAATVLGCDTSSTSGTLRPNASPETEAVPPPDYVINNGATATNDRSITLHFQAHPDADQICFSLLNDRSACDWQWVDEFAETTYTMQLSDQEGAQTIYAWHANSRTNRISDPAPKDITLDRIARSLRYFAPDLQTAATNQLQLRFLYVAPEDAHQICIEIQNFPPECTPIAGEEARVQLHDVAGHDHGYGLQVPAPQAQGVFLVNGWTRDILGNRSVPVQTSVEIDRAATPLTAIEAQLTIPGLTTTRDINVLVSPGTDTASVCILETPDAGACDTAMVSLPDNNIVTVRLSEGDGPKTLYAWSQDAIGNRSSAYEEVSLTLDTTTPQLQFAILGSVDNGTLYTTSTTVRIELTSVTDVHRVCIYGLSKGTNLDCADSEWLSITEARARDFALPDKDGNAQLFGIAKDQAGNISAIESITGIDVRRPVPRLAMFDIGPNSSEVNNSLNVTRPQLTYFLDLDPTEPEPAASLRYCLTETAATPVPAPTPTIPDDQECVWRPFTYTTTHPVTGNTIGEVQTYTMASYLPGSHQLYAWVKRGHLVSGSQQRTFTLRPTITNLRIPSLNGLGKTNNRVLELVFDTPEFDYTSSLPGALCARVTHDPLGAATVAMDQCSTGSPNIYWGDAANQTSSSLQAMVELPAGLADGESLIEVFIRHRSVDSAIIQRSFRLDTTDPGVLSSQFLNLTGPGVTRRNTVNMRATFASDLAAVCVGVDITTRPADSASCWKDRDSLLAVGADTYRFNSVSLNGTPGPQDIYIWTRDEGDNVTGTALSISYDPDAPIFEFVLQDRSSGSEVATDEPTIHWQVVPYSTSPDVTAVCFASVAHVDSNSDGTLECSPHPSTTGWIAPTTTPPVFVLPNVDGTQVVYGIARDAAGNVTASPATGSIDLGRPVPLATDFYLGEDIPSLTNGPFSTDTATLRFVAEIAQVASITPTSATHFCITESTAPPVPVATPGDPTDVECSWTSASDLLHNGSDIRGGSGSINLVDTSAGTKDLYLWLKRGAIVSDFVRRSFTKKPKIQNLTITNLTDSTNQATNDGNFVFTLQAPHVDYATQTPENLCLLFSNTTTGWSGSYCAGAGDFNYTVTSNSPGSAFSIPFAENAAISDGLLTVNALITKNGETSFLASAPTVSFTLDTTADPIVQASLTPGQLTNGKSRVDHLTADISLTADITHLCYRHTVDLQPTGSDACWEDVSLLPSIGGTPGYVHVQPTIDVSSASDGAVTLHGWTKDRFGHISTDNPATQLSYDRDTNVAVLDYVFITPLNNGAATSTTQQVNVASEADAEAFCFTNTNPAGTVVACPTPPAGTMGILPYPGATTSIAFGQWYFCPVGGDCTSLVTFQMTLAEGSGIYQINAYATDDVRNMSAAEEGGVMLTDILPLSSIGMRNNPGESFTTGPFATSLDTVEVEITQQNPNIEFCLSEDPNGCHPQFDSDWTTDPNADVDFVYQGNYTLPDKTIGTRTLYGWSRGLAGDGVTYVRSPYITRTFTRNPAPFANYDIKYVNEADPQPYPLQIKLLEILLSHPAEQAGTFDFCVLSSAIETIADCSWIDSSGLFYDSEDAASELNYFLNIALPGGTGRSTYPVRIFRRITVDGIPYPSTPIQFDVSIPNSPGINFTGFTMRNIQAAFADGSVVVQHDSLENYGYQSCVLETPTAVSKTEHLNNCNTITNSWKPLPAEIGGQHRYPVVLGPDATLPVPGVVSGDKTLSAVIRKKVLNAFDHTGTRATYEDTSALRNTSFYLHPCGADYFQHGGYTGNKLASDGIFWREPLDDLTLNVMFPVDYLCLDDTRTTPAEKFMLTYDSTQFRAYRFDENYTSFDGGVGQPLLTQNFILSGGVSGVDRFHFNEDGLRLLDDRNETLWDAPVILPIGGELDPGMERVGFRMIDPFASLLTPPDCAVDPFNALCKPFTLQLMGEELGPIPVGSTSRRAHVIWDYHTYNSAPISLNMFYLRLGHSITVDLYVTSTDEFGSPVTLLVESQTLVGRNDVDAIPVTFTRRLNADESYELRIEPTNNLTMPNYCAILDGATGFSPSGNLPIHAAGQCGAHPSVNLRYGNHAGVHLNTEDEDQSYTSGIFGNRSQTLALLNGFHAKELTYMGGSGYDERAQCEIERDGGGNPYLKAEKKIAATWISYCRPLPPVCRRWSYSIPGYCIGGWDNPCQPISEWVPEDSSARDVTMACSGDSLAWNGNHFRQADFEIPTNLGSGGRTHAKVNSGDYTLNTSICGLNKVDFKNLDDRDRFSCSIVEDTTENRYELHGRITTSSSLNHRTRCGMTCMDHKRIFEHTLTGDDDHIVEGANIDSYRDLGSENNRFCFLVEATLEDSDSNSGVSCSVHKDSGRWRLHGLSRRDGSGHSHNSYVKCRARCVSWNSWPSP